MCKKFSAPIIFVCALVGVLLLHSYAPIRQLLHAPASYLGAFWVAAALAISIWTHRVFRSAETTVRPFEQPTTLVTSGPYRWTRNPMYLGMVFDLLGACFFLGSASPFFVIPAFVGLVQACFIRSEELALEQAFGSGYTQYRRRVRRWV